MTTRKEVLGEIEYLYSLKTIMETYEEIAASRMQHIRSKVLQSRDFLFEINTIFQQVKSSYKLGLKKLMKARSSFLKSNGKTLFVLISANTGLYGDIIRRTFDVFAKEFKKQKSDIAIIGRVGLNQFQGEFPNMAITYFDLSDDKVEEEAFKGIIPKLIEYEKVLVFYGQFQTIISQVPLVTSISGDKLPMQQDSQIKYFFEPTLEKILEFFEKEIFASIFEQVILESQLAKFASRMVALDKSVDNANDSLKQMVFQKERIRHQILNKKQSELLVSQSLWR